jgi:nitrogen fixation-related uncharacterized protein
MKTSAILPLLLLIVCIVGVGSLSLAQDEQQLVPVKSKRATGNGHFKKLLVEIPVDGSLPRTVSSLKLLKSNLKNHVNYKFDVDFSVDNNIHSGRVKTALVTYGNRQQPPSLSRFDWRTPGNSRVSSYMLLRTAKRNLNKKDTARKIYLFPTVPAFMASAPLEQQIRSRGIIRISGPSSGPIAVDLGQARVLGTDPCAGVECSQTGTKCRIGWAGKPLCACAVGSVVSGRCQGGAAVSRKRSVNSANNRPLLVDKRGASSSTNASGLGGLQVPATFNKNKSKRAATATGQPAALNATLAAVTQVAVTSAHSNGRNAALTTAKSASPIPIGGMFGQPKKHNGSTKTGQNVSLTTAQSAQSLPMGGIVRQTNRNNGTGSTSTTTTDAGPFSVPSNKPVAGTLSTSNVYLIFDKPVKKSDFDEIKDEIMKKLTQYKSGITNMDYGKRSSVKKRSLLTEAIVVRAKRAQKIDPKKQIVLEFNYPPDSPEMHAIMRELKKLAGTTIRNVAGSPKLVEVLGPADECSITLQDCKDKSLVCKATKQKNKCVKDKGWPLWLYILIVLAVLAAVILFIILLWVLLCKKTGAGEQRDPKGKSENLPKDNDWMYGSGPTPGKHDTGKEGVGAADESPDQILTAKDDSKRLSDPIQRSVTAQTSGLVGSSSPARRQGQEWSSTGATAGSSGGSGLGPSSGGPVRPNISSSRDKPPASSARPQSSLVQSSNQEVTTTDRNIGASLLSIVASGVPSEEKVV